MRGRARWTRQAVGLFAIIIMAGACATLAAQIKGNRISRAAAAEVGQREPGPAGVPAMKSAQDAGVDIGMLSPQARQQRELRKLRMQKMKKDARKLAQMARSLEEEIAQSNQNILSVNVVEKAKEIQKLAGRIRDEARF
jgi:methylmalonyl-CoA mutase N-terminal domain/subunit